ncbi:hypothetical protein GQ473_06100 [archaeon]|nr:hypothetical protein [archaeon]
MATFKKEQLSENEYIFCITCELDRQFTIKLPVNYEIIAVLMVNKQMMFYYKTDIDIDHEYKEIILKDSSDGSTTIKQCSLKIIASVELVPTGKIYNLHELHKNLNFIL